MRLTAGRLVADAAAKLAKRAFDAAARIADRPMMQRMAGFFRRHERKGGP